MIQHEGTLHRDAFLMKHGGESLLKDEDTLPRIFFGFLKNKVSTALPQTEVEIERCKHIESYDAQERSPDWNYWRKHRAYRQTILWNSFNLMIHSKTTTKKKKKKKKKNRVELSSPRERP